MSRPTRATPMLFNEVLIAIGPTAGAPPLNGIIYSQPIRCPRDRFLTLTNVTTFVFDGTAAQPQAISHPTYDTVFELHNDLEGSIRTVVVVSSAGEADTQMCSIVVQPGDALIASWRGLAVRAECYSRLQGVYTLL